jgi:hypothetical protein
LEDDYELMVKYDTVELLNMLASTVQRVYTGNAPNDVTDAFTAAILKTLKSIQET